jgi:hypothetical protein
MSADLNQWSTIHPLFGQATMPGWVPEEDRDRLNAYQKYDQIYWNDEKQYALRVLEGEQPLYIPNARIIVDTTSHYLLKGLKITCPNKATQEVIDNFLKREMFYSRFHTAKQSGVARGDWVYHMTANPGKAAKSRITLTSIDPATVFPVYDPDIPERMIACHIARPWREPGDPKSYTRALTYRRVDGTFGETQKITRREAIYSNDEPWWGEDAIIQRTLLPEGDLDSRIKSLPIYWFKNRSWQGDDFGSSELRGFEQILENISQNSTDISAALSLEGLGVYATDGGRPVREDGTEIDWEVAPGRVMEVPQGSYFRRVEGVGSITPAKDQIDYLEDRVNKAAGLSDVALGNVDPVTAASGIALAIHFQPTLAKIEIRDQHGIDILTQLFFDWKTWYEVFEKESLDGDIIPVIGEKLPLDRTARLNELNNMFDRKAISKQFYRDEMEKLGYTFPEDIEKQIQEESQAAAEAARQAFVASQGGQDAVDAANAANNQDSAGKKPTGTGGPNNRQTTLPQPTGNGSNNRNRPNESSGSEAKH